MSLEPSPVLAQEAATGTGSGFGVGAVVLTIIVVAILGWMGYLYVNSRRSRTASREPSPPNLTPYVSDDELENRRTTRVLRASLFAAGLAAVLMPWYAFNEPERQVAAAEEIHELDVEAGEEWYADPDHGFFCVDCHAAEGVGGATQFTEERSGVDTNWLVPSLNDVFYRYTRDEVEHWIVFGRAGTPMPANGLQGGGAMTSQEVDQVIAYLESIQIPQAEAVAKMEPRTGAAITRIETGELITRQFIAVQEAEIEQVLGASETLAKTGGLADEVKDLFSAPGTCTARSAELVDANCEAPGADSDRDGLSDAAEPELTDIALIAHVNLVELNRTTLQEDSKPVYAVSFDPASAFTNSRPDGSPIADLAAADTMLEALELDTLLLQVVTDQSDVFLEGLGSGLRFLEQSAALRLWDIDFVGTALDMTAQAVIDRERALELADDPSVVPEARAVSVADATRAAGLFNAFCARCHTGGWSAGAPFEVGAGRGAWGPAINDGRALVQFPNWLDHFQFVLSGSAASQHYGVNGLGTGRMPGWGAVLTREAIELIVLYERTL